MPWPETERMHQDRKRAEAFGRIADLYDRVRPRYPAALIDALIEGLEEGADVLDVGCGTGIVGEQLQARGVRVLGLEPDARMAARAQAKGIDVELGKLEEWDAGERRFDLITAGTSWHWIDPAAGPRRAAELLRPGGRIALFWNLGEPASPLREQLDEAYRAAGLAVTDHARAVHSSAHRGEVSRAALVANGRFEEPTIRRFPWRRRYSTVEWLEFLSSHSDVATLSPEQRNALLARIGAAVDGNGGALTLPYSTLLVTATVRPRS